MSRRLVLAAALGLAAACVDEDAGPLAVSGRPAVEVGLDLVARGLPGGPAVGRLAGGSTDTLVLTIDHLPVLADGRAYQIWLVDEVQGEAVRVAASYRRQRPDTTGFDEFDGRPIIVWRDVEGPATVRSFPGIAGHRHLLTLRAADLAAAGVAMARFSHVVLTIGGAPDAPPATSPAPAWYRYLDQRGTRDVATDNRYFPSGTVRFGFLPARAAAEVGWSAFGGGSVEFLNVVGVAVRLERIARPPLGFYYDVWLVHAETGRRLRVGEITTPPPAFESLRDADVATGEYVTATEILAANRWATWRELSATFADFTALVVTLAPKDGPPDQLPPTVLYEAAVPPNLDRLPKFTDGFRDRIGR